MLCGIVFSSGISSKSNDVTVFSRKSTSHMREAKNLRDQMDQIEMRVATECKDAFAELQTSMNAITVDGTPFIPFLPYKEYIVQVTPVVAAF